MNKKIIAVIAALTLSVTALAACGDSSSSKADDISQPASQSAPAEETAPQDVAAAADKLRSELKWKDELNELESTMYKSIYQIEDGSFKKAKVFVGAGGATAEEIACFEANDEAGAADIKSKLEKRVEKQKKAFENYVPEEMDKLNAAVIVVKGSCVYMCIADEADKAKEIIG